MNKISKIIKRQPAEAVEEVTDSMSSPEPSAAEWIEPEEVPIIPEDWEALYVPSSNTATLRDWQREFREVEWEGDADTWESQLYD
jgi:hypothetical protein